MLHRRRRHRNTGKDIDTGLDIDINNNRQETWGRTDYIYIYIGRHNWKHLERNQDTDGD